MLNLLTDNYQFLTSVRYAPIKTVAVRLDYNLYLFRAGDIGYAVVESDYLSGMPGIVSDMERCFGVQVMGWCMRKEGGTGTHHKLLPPDIDDYDPNGTNDINHHNYQSAVCTIGQLRYALLKVAFNDL